jgi:SAM-dependent methyltransferase
MISDFYRAFEDKYRGKRDLIKSRLQVYLPFLEPLNKSYPNSQVLDLGCGRGEWLELLRDIGISAHGVDLDINMLSVCQDLNLSVTVADVITYLKNIPNESQISVSGFHIAEHLPFDALQCLVQQSLRVLKPGGFLILETPNPENIIVGSSSFYLDPTHQRPIPPDLLLFLAEYYGFEKFKILRLQEPKDFNKIDNFTLLDVLKGVSPDYALVAQKSPTDDIASITNPIFEIDHGITLEELAYYYQQQLVGQRQRLEVALQQSEEQRQHLEVVLQQSEEQRQHLEVVLQQSEEQRQHLEVVLQQSEEQRQHLEVVLQQSEEQRQHLEVVLQQSEHRFQQALSLALQKTEDQQQHLELMLHKLINSRSMRITLPLRLAAHYARGLKQLIKDSLSIPKSLLKKSSKKILVNLAYELSAKPKLKFIALNLLRYSPSLKHRLKLLTLTSSSSHPKDLEPTHISTLSPHATRIFYDLKKAIEESSNSNIAAKAGMKHKKQATTTV